MTLDDLEKISKIAFSGLGAFVLGYFTVTGKWNEFTLQEEKFCIDKESYYMQAALRSENNPSEVLLARIQKRCGFATQDEARETFQAEKAGYQQLASDEAFSGARSPIPENAGTGMELGSTAKPVQDGWVAFASFDANGSISNFYVSDPFFPINSDKPPPEIGTVLAARWPVNLRQNTEITTGTANPSLGILEAGTCVKLVGETVKQRTIIWAPVALSQCTEDG